MNISTKLLKAAAGSAGGAGLDVDDCFSCFLYDGTGSAQTITNNIDLSGEGGLVWIKSRTNGLSHTLVDTERGASKAIFSNSTSAQDTAVNGYMTSFNSNEFTTGDYSNTAQSGRDFCSWTFRKAPKFFDVVTYTGNGTAGRTVSHNLDAEVGMLVIKNLSNSQDWSVWHRGANGGTNANQWFGWLNLSYAFDDGASPFNDTAPTSTNFTLGTSSEVNGNGENYVAYLFAHNNSDGGFGPDADQDIIKCGSYTGNGSTTGPTVNLGFEPQWLMIKRASGAEDWMLFDAIRNVPTGGLGNDLRANSSGSENSSINFIDFNSTGFQPQTAYAHVNNSSDTYIYMAIRRGPLAEPTSATDVFSVNKTGTGDSPTNVWNIGFNADMNIHTKTNGEDNYILARLLGTKAQKTNATDAAGDQGSVKWFNDSSNRINLNTSWFSGASNMISWSWKRAPGFCDVVCYSGNSTSGRTVSHNLGVAPEMIWVKVRNLSSGWPVLHTGKELYLNSSAAKEASPLSFNNTDPTATSFTLGSYNSVNGSGYNYIAYLFASLAGISKVGSYTGNGSSQNIDCGFSSGARFVLIKKVTSTGSWQVYDTTRGIVAGNDPKLLLDETNAEDTGGDDIDPYSAGFAVTSTGATNESGETFIFYAIA